MIVVDASFVVQAALTPEGLERLAGREAVAPALLWSQAISVLHEMQWRQAISSELADGALRKMERAPIHLRQPGPFLRRQAWEISTRLRWAKTYDAEYVALARILNCPLLTIDARLAREAAREVAILRPADL